MNPVLDEILAEAQGHGWIGPGPRSDQVSHSGAFAELLGEGPGVVFDLGSGGGLPALPAALALPRWQWVLVEAQLRRADHLASAVRRLGLTDRVDVRHLRAEDLARDPSARGRANAVTARSFGRAAVLVECASPLLALGGRLLVSEPPRATDRWPAPALAGFGLSPAVVRRIDGATFATMQQVAPCPPEYPRRASSIKRRPRF